MLIPDRKDFYIWLRHQGAPIAGFFLFCFDTEVLCCLEMGGGGGRKGKGKQKNEKRNKRGIYFCRVTTLRSLVDVRSGIYKTKAGGSTANKLRLSPDRWVINKRRRRLRRKHTPGKLKWDMWQDGHSFPMTPGIWRFIPTELSVSWTLTVFSVSCFPPKMFQMQNHIFMSLRALLPGRSLWQIKQMSYYVAVNRGLILLGFFDIHKAHEMV